MALNMYIGKVEHSIIKIAGEKAHLPPPVRRRPPGQELAEAGLAPHLPGGHTKARGRVLEAPKYTPVRAVRVSRQVQAQQEGDIYFRAPHIRINMGGGDEFSLFIAFI